MIKIISLLIICSFIVSCSSSAKRVIASEDLPDNTYYGAIDMRKTWDCGYVLHTRDVGSITSSRSCSCAMSASDVVLEGISFHAGSASNDPLLSGYDAKLSASQLHNQLHGKYIATCYVNIANIINEERAQRIESIANSSSRIKNDIIWDPELLDTLLKQLEKRKK